MLGDIPRCDVCHYRGPVELAARHHPECPRVADPVRFLLDGLAVGGLGELRRLVELGRTVAASDPRG